MRRKWAIPWWALGVLFLLWLYGIFFAPFRIKTITLFGTYFLIYANFLVVLVHQFAQGKTYVLCPTGWNAKSWKFSWMSEVFKKNNAPFFYLVSVWNLIITSFILWALTPILLVYFFPQTAHALIPPLSKYSIRPLGLLIIVIDLVLGLINNHTKNFTKK
ncbi:MAG: hypothetical protein Q7S65_04470 [Nanoarchaeota archaeon]|nr:hypothetical protein [Nanoarchaeota archaeon]